MFFKKQNRTAEGKIILLNIKILIFFWSYSYDFWNNDSFNNKVQFYNARHFYNQVLKL